MARMFTPPKQPTGPSTNKKGAGAKEQKAPQNGAQVPQEKPEGEKG